VRLDRRARSGLTLIEVLLSLAILVMALAAIGRLVDIGTDRGNDARMHGTAARLASSKLGEFESGAVSFEVTTGDFADLGEPGWSWQAAVEPHATNLYLVTVTVTRDVGGRPYSFSLAQMMFDPTMLGAAAEAARPTTEEMP